ncbi:MAG: ribonuclease H-like domain-containing protein [Candidatus Parcubacteria bacterium]|nr:ribonuclease H-like domain-containing protein [Candidatus Parcubacteria bacterium]
MNPKLIFDIETIGENWDDLDKTTQHALTRWIKKDSFSEEQYKSAMEEAKNGLGFSPYTGQIVAIGVMEVETGRGAVYFQSPDKKTEDFEEKNIKFKVLNEKEMLQSFWQGAIEYSEFISFNGRGFDVPFLMIRSAINGIKPTKNLMSNRYVNSQTFNAQHIDLMDQLTFYSAVRRSPSLHLACRAFGIKSPKEDGVDGDAVRPLFEAKEYLKIAKYNLEDLKATRELYLKWNEFINIK